MVDWSFGGALIGACPIQNICYQTSWYLLFVLRRKGEKTNLDVKRNLIRHEPDVLVLLSAVAAQPDWLLSHNTKHFTPVVAQRTALRIATPLQFFRTLSALLR